MQAECRNCTFTDTVEYEDETHDTCVCCECGARYEVEHSADFDGQDWRDDSSPGKRLG